MDRVLKIIGVGVFGGICGYALAVGVTFVFVFLASAIDTGADEDEPLEGLLLFYGFVLVCVLLGAIAGGVFAWHRTRTGAPLDRPDR